MTRTACASISVEFHPAYHALMRRSVAAGLHASIWDAAGDEASVRTVARAARLYMTAQAECGHLCPMTMTNASVAALAHAPDLADTWLPQDPDPPVRFRCAADARQAGRHHRHGHDREAGRQRCRPDPTVAEDGRDGIWRITGHKWFMSAPMSDAFLVLARSLDGLSCFLMPRFLPDGTPERASASCG